MKIAVLIAVGLTCVYSTNALASQYKFVAMDSSHETKLCIHAGANQAKKMKVTLRRMGIHERKANINSIRCNDVSPAKFAHEFGANETFNYLNKLSFGKNKVKSSVTIKDVAQNQPKPAKVVYVSAGR
ncbi:DUF3718 domain-containing protein [Thalassotalea euphylliae]|uniref:DUF3718 domain-containing protein n=1 Tax=Thalassotalea euphylliae TaxID=1655234 RepID=UPI00363B2FE6